MFISVSIYENLCNFTCVTDCKIPGIEDKDLLFLLHVKNQDLYLGL